MKLPISWATKTPIPSSELSTTGKGLHPGNGECFKGSLSRRHKRPLALRDTSQTGAPERPRPHNPKKRAKRSLSHRRKRRAALRVVDGTMVGANASRQSRVPREQLKEAAQLSRTVQEYLTELEQVNPVSDAEMISTTDPDAILTTKGGGTAMMAYYDNYLIDTASRAILGVEATPALSRQEMVAARRMIARVEERGLRPESLGARLIYRQNCLRCTQIKECSARDAPWS